MLRKIFSHLAIVLGGMCLVLTVTDLIKGGAMSFFNNNMTKTFIILLSVLAIVNSVISLTAQTAEQKLRALLQQYRRKVGAVPQRPAAKVEARPVRTAAAPAATRPVRSAQSATRARNPYSR